MTILGQTMMVRGGVLFALADAPAAYSLEGWGGFCTQKVQDVSCYMRPIVNNGKLF